MTGIGNRRVSCSMPVSGSKKFKTRSGAASAMMPLSARTLRRYRGNRQKAFHTVRPTEMERLARSRKPGLGREWTGTENALVK
jgi:hypothetical protein